VPDVAETRVLSAPMTTTVNLLAILTVAACGGDHPPAAAPSNTPAPEACSTRAAAVTTYLTQLFAPDSKVPPPWPVGNADLDAKINAARDHLREAMKPDPDGKAKQLSAGFKPGMMDATLEGCPQAKDAVTHIPDFPEPDHMTKAAQAIGAGIAACDCKLDIPLVTSGFYLIVRGPD
jgi:hypothetical protein